MLRRADQLRYIALLEFRKALGPVLRGFRRDGTKNVRLRSSGAPAPAARFEPIARSVAETLKPRVGRFRRARRVMRAWDGWQAQESLSTLANPIMV